MKSLQERWYWRLLVVITTPVWLPLAFLLGVCIIITVFLFMIILLPIEYIITGKTKMYSRINDDIFRGLL